MFVTVMGIVKNTGKELDREREGQGWQCGLHGFVAVIEGQDPEASLVRDLIVTRQQGLQSAGLDY